MLLKTAWRIVVIVIGFTVVAIGVVMILAPGPATIVIPAGLAILATEFLWARRLLNRMKRKAGAMLGRDQPSIVCQNCEGDLTGKPLKGDISCPDCDAPVPAAAREALAASAKRDGGTSQAAPGYSTGESQGASRRP